LFFGGERRGRENWAKSLKQEPGEQKHMPDDTKGVVWENQKGEWVRDLRRG